jgi:WD40 repeat protein
MPPALKAILEDPASNSNSTASRRPSATPFRVAAFAHGSKLVLTGSDDGNVRLWDAATGQPVGKPLSHPGSIRGLTLSPEGRLVLVGGLFPNPVLWDIASGKVEREFIGHREQTWALAIRGDGKAVLTGGSDRTARLWDTASGKQLCPPLEHPDWVWSVAFIADGDMALTSCKDRAVRLWDLRTGAVVGKPIVLADDVTGVFSYDGKSFLTVCKDGSARLWDTTTREQVGSTLRLPSRSIVVAFGGDGPKLVTCSPDWTFRDLNLKSGEIRQSSLPTTHTELLTAAFSPDGRSVLTADFDGQARVWERPTESARDEFPCGRWVASVAVSPDGKTLLTGAADLPFPFGKGPLPFGKGEMRLWDLESRKPLCQPVALKHAILSADFSPDGNRILTGGGLVTGSAGEYRVWDRATLITIGKPVAVDATVYVVSFDPSGRTYVVGMGRGQSGLATKFMGIIGKSGLAGANLETRLVSVVGSGEALIFDAATNKLLVPLQQPAWVTSAAYSPDGKTLLTGGADGIARLWDVETGKSLGRDIVVGNSVIGVTYSKDGKTFAAGTGNGVVKIFNADTGEFTGKVFAQKGWIRSVALNADGTLALSAGEQKGARLWDLTTGEAIGPPLEHNDSVLCAVFTPDGRHIVTGSCDNSARVWDSPSKSDISAERVSRWLEARTGLELSSDGVLRQLDCSTWNARRDSLQADGGEPEW